MRDELATGRVIALIRRGDSVSARLNVNSAVNCARCSSGRGCGAGLFGASSPTELNVPVPEGMEVRVGDELRLVAPGQDILTLTVVTYGWPLVGLLAGGLLGELVAGSEVAGIVAAATGLVAGVLLARRRLRSRCWRERSASFLRVEEGAE